jgi:ankyrin repeat protein
MIEAARKADVGALKVLVGRGGDVNASYRNYRPLHSLIQERPHDAPPGRAEPRRLTCLAWLLDHGADPDALGAWPSSRAILVAAFAGVPEYVELLRERGARVDLHVEAALGELASVRKRLARDRAIAGGCDEGGLTPLVCCAGSRLFDGDERGSKRLREIAALLLDAGADPDARIRSWGHDVDAAYFAIGAQHLEMLELLLARGAAANRALVSAAWKDDKRFAEAALRAGAVPDEAREGDRPLLNELVRWGQLEHALWLLARGASPNVPDARGWTALHQAVSRGNERMLRALLDAKGDPRRKDAEEITPFEMAVAKGRKKLIALFG